MDKILTTIKEKITILKEETTKDLQTIFINKSDILPLLTLLKTKLNFTLLLDITAIDNLKRRSKTRFTLVYLVREYTENRLLTIKIDLEDNDLNIESASNIYKSANWGEREVYDQYGITFTNHPNLKRILNHKEFEGHPLRKDYPITKYQLLHSADDLMDEMGRRLVDKGYLCDYHLPFSEIKNEMLKTNLMFINIGPSHPATHGTIRNLAALDGEKIVASVTEMGYLHRGFEKSCENHTYNQIIPYTDRLNYCSAILNNVGYAKTIEEMLDVTIPDRAIFMRVILSELSRIIDHIVCLSALFVDSGGLTNFWFLYNTREEVYSFLSKLTGARLTNSFTRIGGMVNDFYEGWEDELEGLLKGVEKGVSDALSLAGSNKIFLDRVQNVCTISKDNALSYGLTGPNLRASGVDFDLRKDNPYYYYESFDFSVPVGTVGDIYDRIMVRFAEIEESISITRQAMKTIPKGPVNADKTSVVLPSKENVYGNIEGLMNHFKLVFEGVKVPSMEYYSAVEGGNGELGFYVVSDGTGTPYKIKVRPPCFYGLNSFSETVEGHMLADSILNLGSLNIIAGELDR